jgi:hypothetical protein
MVPKPSTPLFSPHRNSCRLKYAVLRAVFVGMKIRVFLLVKSADGGFENSVPEDWSGLKRRKRDREVVVTG